MFGKLGELFGGKKKPARPGTKAKGPAKGKADTEPTGPPPLKPVKLRRVNVERRFTILGETGKGSMSKVYRALDTKSGRVVCLKVQDREKTEAALARAAQSGRPTEGQIAAALNHPNIVKVFEFGLTSRREYFVAMEFVEGPNLRELRQTRVTDVAQRVELLAQAAQGLATVHAKGFIHRDVGPKNLLVDANDRVKIIDFGLTVPNTPAFRRPGNRTGTLNYMAPELLRRETTDERIDIYSFGATAFEFLTGRLPFDDAGKSIATMMQRISQSPLDPAQVRSDLPEPLCEILRRTLARHAADRWPTMATLPDALRNSVG